MREHIGSTIAIILGALSVLSGLANPGAAFITGIIIILGALAYRSAKNRKLGKVHSSIIRKALEAVAILIAMAAVLMQNNLVSLIQADPVPNLIIPLWVLLAYIIILVWSPKRSSNEQA